MTRFALTIALLYGCLLSRNAFCLEQLTAENVPSLIVAGPFDDHVTYICKIRNSGTVPYKIKGVTTSCTCETAKINADNIKPGRVTSLAVTIKTPSTSQTFISSVIIDSKDNALAPLQIDFRIKKIPLIQYTTRLVSWNNSESLSPKSIEFTLYSKAKVTSIISNNNKFATRIERFVDSDCKDQLGYKLWVSPISSENSYSTDITLVIDEVRSEIQQLKKIDFFAAKYKQQNAK